MNHGIALSGNRKGGIEGLPMELLIIIVVAAVGVTLILGWFSGLGDQQPVTYGNVSSDVTMLSVKDSLYTVNGDTSCADTDFDITVHVIDSKGDGIGDAVVKLSGLGIQGTSTFGQTGSSGDITFRGLSLRTLPHGIGYIIVSVSSSIGDTELKIPVVVE